jgi:hypothetical protein
MMSTGKNTPTIDEKEDHIANNPQTEAMKREHVMAWHNHSMHADIWFGCASVKPVEAAMLLCRLDPLTDKDPENIYVDDDRTSPGRYRVLKRIFEDIAESDPKSRTLLAWREVARCKGLRYHEWIDEYAPITAGDTGNNYVQPEEEPPMKSYAHNSRANCMAWCAFKSGQYSATTRQKLAEKIIEEATCRHYWMARNHDFSIDMVVQAIPKGTTGTLKDNRNGGKSQA